MKNKQMETKSKSALRIAPHLIARVMCLGAVILICSSAPAQNLFMSGWDGVSGAIFEFTPNGVRTTFASGLAGPVGLAFDSAGNLFVADLGPGYPDTGRIYKFTSAGVQTTFALGLHYPWRLALAFDSAGNLFVADGGTIYKFTPTGARTTFATLDSPLIAYGLALDSAGNLFVAAAGGNLLNNTGKIYKFTPTGVRTTFASGLILPFALAFDSRGNLFVADGGCSDCDWPIIVGAVYKFTPSGTRSTFASGFPTGLAIDSADNLFVADGGILKFTPSGVRTTFASGVSGALAFQPVQTPTPTPTPTPAPTPTPTPTPPAMPAVSLRASPTSVNKGGTATFTATASKIDLSEDMLVNFSTGGTAGNGSDYTLSANQITIPAGQPTGSVTLQVMTTKTKGKEKATMTLQPGTGYTVVTKHKANVAKVTIRNK